MAAVRTSLEWIRHYNELEKRLDIALINIHKLLLPQKPISFPKTTGRKKVASYIDFIHQSRKTTVGRKVPRSLYSAKTLHSARPKKRLNKRYLGVLDVFDNCPRLLLNSKSLAYVLRHSKVPKTIKGFSSLVEYVETKGGEFIVRHSKKKCDGTMQVYATCHLLDKLCRGCQEKI